ncbi:Cysteine-rich receptor-like protein kinase 10 [Hordeum vulgare]|nr:Cysteine-rich receptor-like protein kinase 10 [Hordeum vulgare]KAE8802396.1 Cysteine-rich receptor-like protein kinase 10 [Hordeum vulgare]
MINKIRIDASPPRGHLRLAKPKKEPTIPVVKKKHVEMVADLDTGLKWSCDDYVREEMECQCRALEEIAERRRGRDEGGVIVLSDSDEEATAPTKPIRSGDPGQGCSKDDGVEDKPSDDYTIFYNLLRMN